MALAVTITDRDAQPAMQMDQSSEQPKQLQLPELWPISSDYSKYAKRDEGLKIIGNCQRTQEIPHITNLQMN